MKRFVAASAIVLIIAILGIPSFARGPGWGRGSDTAGSWGRDSGYCWQTDKGYGDFTPEKREDLYQNGRQNYERFASNAPKNRWFGRGFGWHMRSKGHMGMFGMGWWR